MTNARKDTRMNAAPGHTSTLIETRAKQEDAARRLNAAWRTGVDARLKYRTFAATRIYELIAATLTPNR
jgi:hypothetical protein